MASTPTGLSKVLQEGGCLDSPLHCAGCRDSSLLSVVHSPHPTLKQLPRQAVFLILHLPVLTLSIAIMKGFQIRVLQ